MKNARLAGGMAALALCAFATAASAGRPEGRDDATFVHDALICMGTYQYILDTGTDNYAGTILKQASAEGVYRKLGKKTEAELEADKDRAASAIRTLVDEDPANLETYRSGCDGEFMDYDEDDDE